MPSHWHRFRNDVCPYFVICDIKTESSSYSGVAWAYSNQPDDIKIITEWDCIEFQNSGKGKAPTRIAYRQQPLDPFIDNTGDDISTEVAWGYGVEDANAAEWFK